MLVLAGCTPYGASTGLDGDCRGCEPVPEVPVEEPVAGGDSWDAIERSWPDNDAQVWLVSDVAAQRYESMMQDGAVGDFEVSVPAGANAYYVKFNLVTMGQSSPVAAAFIAPGGYATVQLPAGGMVYDVYYGAGTEWYGWSDAFGPHGAYAQADERFALETGGGWQISLELSPGGNLGANGLGYEEFLR